MFRFTKRKMLVNLTVFLVASVVFLCNSQTFNQYISQLCVNDTTMNLLYPSNQFRKLSHLSSASKKTMFTLKHTMESSPVVWGEKLYIIDFNRQENQIRFYNEQGNLVKTLEKPSHLGSAFVDKKDQLHLLHTADSKCINQLTINKNYSIADERNIFCSDEEGEKIFNTSLSQAEDKYYIAYEVSEKNSTTFYTKFLISNDLKHWKKLDYSFRKGTYTACPTLRYFNGEFYIFFLDLFYDTKNNNQLTFVTRAAKGKSLNQLTMIKEAVLDPRDSQGTEGVNNSDFDFIAFNNKVVICYADGDQQTYANVKVAQFDGTLEEYYKALTHTTPSMKLEYMTTLPAKMIDATKIFLKKWVTFSTQYKLKTKRLG